MSDESKQPETEGRRKPMADPRLQREKQQASGLAQVAMFAGWGAALAAVAFLLWWLFAGKVSLGPKIVLAVAVVLAIFWAYTYRDMVKAAAGTRGARLGTNSAVYSLFVLGILVLINRIRVRPSGP